MKVISTINFKGGVGKTTITWLLAKHASEKEGMKVLVVDADAQMSLTLALGVDEDNGSYVAGFEEWYSRHIARQKSLLDAIVNYDAFCRGDAKHFDYAISRDVAYEVHPNLHMIPSTTDLYWLELDLFSPESLRGFVGALLGRIEHSRVGYDLVLFDCPPSFTALSYSVLCNCSLILVPTNPDVFAASGLRIMVDGLRHRITPWPDPKVAVFMNKARYYGGRLTRETQLFLDNIQDAAKTLASEGKGSVSVLDAIIPERAAIRRAISFGGFPEEFRPDIRQLWKCVQDALK